MSSFVSVPVDLELARFEESASVRLAMTFDVQTCEVGDPVGAVVAKPELAGIDFVPVRKRGSVVGVLARADAMGRLGATVAEVMQPLASEIFVAGSEPLLPVIEALDQEPQFRLVIESRRVLGILTLSDLQKLPVRSLLFGRIAHLELLLMAVIRRRTGGTPERWLPLLNQARSERTKAKFAELRKSRSELDILEATDFCDKRDLIAALGGLPGWSMKQLEKVLRRTEELRNQVAHAAGYADSHEQALGVIALTRDLRDLISILRAELSISGPEATLSLPIDARAGMRMP